MLLFHQHISTRPERADLTQLQSTRRKVGGRHPLPSHLNLLLRKKPFQASQQLVHFLLQNGTLAEDVADDLRVFLVVGVLVAW